MTTGRRPRVMRACAREGCTRRFRSRRRGAEEQQFCSRRCAGLARPKRIRECRQCQTPFHAKVARQKYCGKACGDAAKRLPKKHCRQCAYKFRPRLRRQVFCSPECRSKAIARKLGRAHFERLGRAGHAAVQNRVRRSKDYRKGYVTGHAAARRLARAEAQRGLDRLWAFWAAARRGAQRRTEVTHAA